MAGHSQFKNIMHRKGAQDAKRARIFLKSHGRSWLPFDQGYRILV